MPCPRPMMLCKRTGNLESIRPGCCRQVASPRNITACLKQRTKKHIQGAVSFDSPLFGHFQLYNTGTEGRKLPKFKGAWIFWTGPDFEKSMEKLYQKPYIKLRNPEGSAKRKTVREPKGFGELGGARQCGTTPAPKCTLPLFQIYI